MNTLDSAIAGDVSRAYSAIADIAQMRAQARAEEIAELSHGQVSLMPFQVTAIADEIKAEMIRDLTRDVRTSLSFFVTRNNPPKV